MKDRICEKMKKRFLQGGLGVLFIGLCLIALSGCLLAIRPVEAAESKAIYVLYAVDNKKTPIEGAEFSCDLVAEKHQDGSYQWAPPYKAAVRPDRISAEEIKTLPEELFKQIQDKGSASAVTDSDGKCVIPVKQDGIYLVWQSDAKEQAEQYEEAKPLLVYMPQLGTESQEDDQVLLEPKTKKKNESEQPEQPSAKPDTGKTDSDTISGEEKPSISDEQSKTDSDNKTDSTAGSTEEKPVISDETGKKDENPEDSDSEKINKPDEAGSVMLTKVDSENHKKVLAGAKFDLYKADDTGNGVLIGQYTTDGQGEISVSGIGYGRYWFIETKAPDGYILNPAKIHFQMNETTSPGTDYPWQITFENTKGTVSTSYEKGGSKTNGNILQTSFEGTPPKTGDYTGIAIWAALIAASGACLIFIFMINRKHGKEERDEK